MSRAPRRLNLAIYKGDTFRLKRRWSVGETFETRVPVDFTGATAEAMIRRTHSNPEVLWRLSTNDDSIVLGPDGWIELVIKHADTATFRTWTEGVWDMEILFANGDKRTLFQGDVYVDPEVTHG